MCRVGAKSLQRITIVDAMKTPLMGQQRCCGPLIRLPPLDGIELNPLGSLREAVSEGERDRQT